ncbi:MAG: hypothetical protein IKU20_08860 [Lachnospiraceae bacterium]|nr:hypothetical protein [Lachnospiraceae bacterium]
MNFLVVAQCLFENTWKLFTGVKIPGIGISAAAVLIGIFLIFFSVQIIKEFLGGRK